MRKLQFTTTIQATRDRIWATLLQDATYREWTAVFSPGSYAETDWQTGSKALFLGPGENGAPPSGMLSRIAEHRPGEYLAIEHLGMVKNGVEDTESVEVKAWAGARETYALSDAGAGAAMLTVEMDSTEGHASYFEETWPKALAEVKRIAES
ncbi:MAG: SRPBCC domain-containing protein [Bryobacterales bacterium]|nr:SRPBCC domain-containing protein [Bryobacterales bacterium]